MPHTYLLQIAAGLKVLPSCRKNVPESLVVKCEQCTVQMLVAGDVQHHT